MIRTANGGVPGSLRSITAESWERSTDGCTTADKLTHFKRNCSLAFQVTDGSNFDGLLGAIDAAENAKRDKLF
jgi:hypothetical protein